MAGQQTQSDRQAAANPNAAPAAARKAPAKQTPAQVEATAAKNLKMLKNIDPKVKDGSPKGKAPKAPKAPKGGGGADSPAQDAKSLRGTFL